MGLQIDNQQEMRAIEAADISWPANLAALDPYVWLDATRYSGSDGDAVASAVNYGSLGGNFVQSSAGKKPTFRPTGLSSLPAFQFDGGDCLTLPNVALSTFTCLVLFRATVDGLVYEHGAAIGSANGSNIYTDINQSCYVMRQIAPETSGASGKNLSASWGIGDVVLLVRQNNAGTDATHTLWIDGVEQSLSTSGSSSLSASPSIADTLNIGARNDAASLGLTGHIAQFLLFTPDKTEAVAAAAEAMISAKYP